jgi:hypothetical protein
MVIELGYSAVDFVVFIVVVLLGIILTIEGYYWGFFLNML